MTLTPLQLLFGVPIACSTVFLMIVLIADRIHTWRRDRRDRLVLDRKREAAYDERMAAANGRPNRRSIPPRPIRRH